MNWKLFENSLLVAGSTTALALALGFLAALCLATAPVVWRRVLLAGTMTTLALPPFLLVNHWLELFGVAGAWQRWLPVPLYSLGGTIAVLSLMLWPISALLIVGAWDRVEPARWEGDAQLCGRALIRWVLWPAARGSASLAALLTFVIAFNQFSVPVILQVPVYPEELWLALTARLNNTGAWAAAWPMILAPAVFLLACRRDRVQWPRTGRASTPERLARPLGSGWRRSVTITTAALLGVSLILPLVHLLASSRTWAELPGLVLSSRRVVLNSFVTAAATAAACMGLGLVMMRRNTPAGRWMSWVIFFVPGVLLAKSLIHLFGGTVLYGTTALLLGAFTLRYFGVAWEGAAQAWRGMDRQLLEVGTVDGARGWTLFRHYAWPQLARPVAATGYVIYLLALWDVETLVLIYPPGGETLGLRIFHLLHYGHTAQVNAMCIVLLALAVAPLVAWAGVRQLLGKQE